MIVIFYCESVCICFYYVDKIYVCEIILRKNFLSYAFNLDFVEFYF